MSLLRCENLKFSYTPGSPLLDIPHFSLDEGEKVFLYGPSGLGKSTLLNIITGVLTPQSGSVYLEDQDIFALSSSQRDRLRGEKMGYIFQNFNLIPYLNIEENILLPSKIFSQGISTAQWSEQAHDLMKTLNLFEYKKKRPDQLSIGQQQRVAQARSLLGSPKLLVADEPTSSLDEKNTQEFMNCLLQKSQEQKITILFVSHDQRLQKYFDRTIDLQEINSAKNEVSR